MAVKKKKGSKATKNRKDSEYPYIDSKRVQEVNDFFSKHNIQYDNENMIGQNIRRPGINAPFEKFTLLKSKGRLVRVAGKTGN